MSSRVRLMLQDFVNTTSWTGRMAYHVLQGLYTAWEVAQSRPTKTSKVVWKKVTDRFGQDHPYLTQAFVLQVPDMDWEGGGYYQRVTKVVEMATKNPGPLPNGPKWLRALEMWERLRPSHADRYSLFVSRDNRRQVWRRSLCNPYFQEWGFKTRPAKPKAKGLPAHRVAEDGPWLDDVLARHRPAGGQGQTGQPTERAKPPKPRVGIWV